MSSFEDHVDFTLAWEHMVSQFDGSRPISPSFSCSEAMTAVQSELDDEYGDILSFGTFGADPVATTAASQQPQASTALSVSSLSGFSSAFLDYFEHGNAAGSSSVPIIEDDWAAFGPSGSNNTLADTQETSDLTPPVLGLNGHDWGLSYYGMVYLDELTAAEKENLGIDLPSCSSHLGTGPRPSTPTSCSLHQDIDTDGSPATAGPGSVTGSEGLALPPMPSLEHAAREASSSHSINASPLSDEQHSTPFSPSHGNKTSRGPANAAGDAQSESGAEDAAPVSTRPAKGRRHPCTVAAPEGGPSHGAITPAPGRERVRLSAKAAGKRPAEADDEPPVRPIKKVKLLLAPRTPSIPTTSVKGEAASSSSSGNPVDAAANDAGTSAGPADAQVERKKRPRRTAGQVEKHRLPNLPTSPCPLCGAILDPADREGVTIHLAMHKHEQNPKEGQLNCLWCEKRIPAPTMVGHALEKHLGLMYGCPLRDRMVCNWKSSKAGHVGQHMRRSHKGVAWN